MARPGVVVVVKSAGPASALDVLGKDQVAVACEDAHVVGVFVERMLPAALADDAQQDHLARMHMRVAVVGLMGILVDVVVRIHVIGHGAAVDHEVGRVVRLGGDAETASGGAGDAARGVDLGLGLLMNAGIHLGELEEILAVVAGFGVVVGGSGEAEVAVTLWLISRGQVVARVSQRQTAACRHCGWGGLGNDDNRAVQSHLHLKIALGAAVVGAGARR